jgi:serine/threonine protein kinase
MGGAEARRYDICPLGSLVLNEQIAKTGSSSVFSASIAAGASPAATDVTPQKKRRVESPTASTSSTTAPPAAAATHTVVVKYYNDCYERRAGLIPPVHPLMHEAAVMQMLEPLEIVPKMLHLSPVVRVGDWDIPTRIRSVWLDTARISHCAAIRAEVRFIVMEQVGPSVGDYMSWLRKQPVSTSSARFEQVALILSVKVTNLFQQFHEAGFVHNDIHGGNIAFRRKVSDFSEIDVETDDLVLIDFGLTEFIADKIGTDIHRPFRNDLNVELLSLGQLNNQRPGPRDDLFRYTEMLANWLSRGHFRSGWSRIFQANLAAVGDPSRGTSAYAEVQATVAQHIKARENYFEYSVPLASSIISNPTISGDNHRFLMESLESIVQHLRESAHPDELPDYDGIRELFNRALTAITI